MWLLGALASTKPVIVVMLLNYLCKDLHLAELRTARREWNDLVVNRMPNISTNFLDEYEREVFFIVKYESDFFV